MNSYVLQRVSEVWSSRVEQKESEINNLKTVRKRFPILKYRGSCSL